MARQRTQFVTKMVRVLVGVALVVGLQAQVANVWVAPEGEFHAPGFVAGATPVVALDTARSHQRIAGLNQASGELLFTFPERHGSLPEPGWQGRSSVEVSRSLIFLAHGQSGLSPPSYFSI
jgi:hypothetical protein